MTSLLKTIMIFISTKRKIFMLVLSLVFIALCCTFIVKCKGGKYNFSTDDEALEEYRSFLCSLQKDKSMNADNMKKKILEWRELSDTVFSFLRKDSVFSMNSTKGMEYYTINDSIKTELYRLTETWKCSFNDIINIKELTSQYYKDEDINQAVSDATPFFVSLDSANIPKLSKEKAIELYRDVLTEVGNKGINNFDELLTFIRIEDYAFRTFLPHLHELENDRISDITRKTERICHNIFIETQKGTMPSREVLIYMSMRTVRRLIQNSVACVDDINKREMKSREQANAYLWMIIQPYTNIDALAISTLTAENKKDLKYIAEQIPKSSMFAKTFNINQDALKYLLPQQILKMYILSL